MKTLPFPDWYNRADILKLMYQGEWGMKARKEADEFANRYNITNAGDDDFKIKLVLVDNQIDFVFPDGSLAVPGAVEDTQRLIEWIFRNLQTLSNIEFSLDSHLPLQIFDPAWWRLIKREDPNDIDSPIESFELPSPFTPVKFDDIYDSIVPVFDENWSLGYSKKMKAKAQRDLMLWMPHTPIGGVGRAIVPQLYYTIVFWAVARNSNPSFVDKGFTPQTEHYGIIRAEQEVAGRPETMRNERFLADLLKYDAVFVAGQAKSHCVLDTVLQMVEELEREGHVHMLEKLYILTDGTSSVGGGPSSPTARGEAYGEPTWEELAQPQYDKLASQYGLNLVKTTDEMENLFDELKAINANPVGKGK